VNTALHLITTYIPTEVLTLYVAVLAALQKGADSRSPQWLTFWFFLVVTPILVWLVYAAKVKNSQKPLPTAPSQWPIWQMAAATVAYAAWAFALPETPFIDEKWYSAALGGIIVLITSTVL